MFNLLPITTCSFLSAKPQKYSQEYTGAEFAESRKARYVPPSPAQFPVSSSSPWWVWTCIPDKCTHAQKYTSNAQISDHTDRENIGFQSLIILTHIVSALFLLIDLLYIMKGHYQVPLKPSCLKDEQLQLSQSVLIGKSDPENLVFQGNQLSFCKKQSKTEILPKLFRSSSHCAPAIGFAIRRAKMRAWCFCSSGIRWVYWNSQHRQSNPFRFNRKEINPFALSNRNKTGRNPAQSIIKEGNIILATQFAKNKWSGS